MRITKVYTRKGDEGLTRLVGGQKVPKNDPRIEAYGTVDELNAIVGLVRTELGRAEFPVDRRDQLDGWLEQVQNDLFNLGSELATRSEDRWEGMRLSSAADVSRLESQIDAMNEDLAPLDEFILPGGGAPSAFLHQARTVCRRAERCTLTLDQQEKLKGQALVVLNRMSDWFFVAGRWAAHAMDIPETAWDRNH